MLKQLALCGILTAAAVAGSPPVSAAELPSDADRSPVIALPQDQVGGGAAEGAAGEGGNGLRATKTMLAAIVTWLAENFDLPPTSDHPRIEYASPADMAVLRYQALFGPTRREAAVVAARDLRLKGMRELVAFYNDRTRTIYLPSEWTGRSAVDLSVLVHEMVHHLQNVSAMTYECAMGREKIAYRAQNKWLSLSDRSLAGEFGIDAMTMLVTTSCAFH